MTVHLVTFATDDYSVALNRCVSSAMQYGVTQTHPCHPLVLPPETQLRSHGNRGYGWWQWKPMVIQIAMNGCADGDVLIYADAGIEFIGDVNEIIQRMDQDLWLFGNNWPHYAWCKRDVIDEVYHEKITQMFGPDKTMSWSSFQEQCQASVIFFRVSNYSKAFVKEWLDWCLLDGGRLIDDSPSRTPNHPEFREHRHDQAILTTMAYREGIKLHWWPASYNDGAFTYDKLPVYAADNYPVLFNHHRRRNHEWAKCA